MEFKKQIGSNWERVKVLEKKYKVMINGSEFIIEQQGEVLKIDGYVFEPKLISDENSYRVFIEGEEISIQYQDESILLNGKEIDFQFTPSPTLLAKKTRGGNKTVEIKAAIPGRIVEVLVKKGQMVADQECLVILESMKMRNEILSPIIGKVEKIAIQEDSQVSTNQLLLTINPQK
jgi:pyruvate carboxylase